MLKPLTLLALLATLSACGTTSGGVRGEIAFRATGHTSEFTSDSTPANVAACFQRSAHLLPFSLVSTDPADGAPVYRLRYQDYWFEQIAFHRGPSGGTRVEVVSSGNYDRGWTSMLVRDRLAPLGACLQPSPALAAEPPRGAAPATGRG